MLKTESTSKRTPPAVVYAAAISLILLLTVVEACRWRVSRSTSLDSAIQVATDLALRPDTFYRVAWESVTLPDVLPSGGTVRALVTLRNASSFMWPDAQMADPAKRGGAGAVRIGYRWWRPDEAVVISDYDQRTSLPWPMASLGALTLPVQIQLPATAGRYRLQIDLVHELVTWFEKRGAAPLLIPVVVQPRG